LKIDEDIPFLKAQEPHFSTSIIIDDSLLV